MLDFAIKGDAEVRAATEKAVPNYIAAVIHELDQANLKLREHITADKLSGQVLKQRTGNLIRNILFFPAEQKGTTVEGSVGLGSNAAYGLAHEYGAHIPDRYPVNAQALSWVDEALGRRVFYKHARAFDLPERSFMRSSFAEMTDYIVERINAAGAQVAK